jgi:hypothetical protein
MRLPFNQRVHASSAAPRMLAILHVFYWRSYAWCKGNFLYFGTIEISKYPGTTRPTLQNISRHTSKSDHFSTSMMVAVIQCTLKICLSSSDRRTRTPRPPHPCSALIITSSTSWFTDKVQLVLLCSAILAVPSLFFGWDPSFNITRRPSLKNKIPKKVHPNRYYANKRGEGVGEGARV